MTAQQPEALRLSEILNSRWCEVWHQVAAAKELRRLHAENEALKQQIAATQPAAQGMDALDAKRYRWLRECNSGSLVVVEITGTGDEDWHVLTEADADAAIDAALAAQAKQGGA